MLVSKNLNVNRGIVSTMIEKTICVTGASRGLGQALAKTYAKQAKQIHLLGRDKKALTDTQQQCINTGSDAYIHACDVRQTKSLTNLIQSIDTQHSIDCMIVNAGISESTLGYSDDSIIMDTNLTSAIATIQAILPSMLKRGRGRIMVVSSLVAFLPSLPSANAYHTSKQALLNYTRSLALIHQNTGLTIQCICPGFITTQMTQSHRFPMLGLMSAEQAANRIVKLSQRKKTLLIFPLYLYWITWLLSFIPHTILDYIDKQYSKSPIKD